MTKKTTRKPTRPLTILTAIVQLLELAENSQLSDRFFEEARPLTDFLHGKLDISPVQAVFLAEILNGDRDEYVPLSCISSSLGCKNVQLLPLLEELDNMERRRIVTCNRRCDDHGYHVPNAVLDAFKRNEPYVPEPLAGLDPDMFLSKLDDLYDQLDDDDISLEVFIPSLRDLIDSNPQLALCRELKGLALNDESLALLLFFVVRLVIYNDDNIVLGQFGDVFSGDLLRAVRSAFAHHHHPLVTAKHVVPFNFGLNDDNEGWRLSEDIRNKMLVDYRVERRSEPTDASLRAASDIAAKNLYYNASEQEQVHRLGQLLDRTHFDEVCRRLSEKGLRKGFNCIFYGPPGTGKTETVLQLARATGRDIMQVDIPEVKSAWVGESEKNVKAIFTRYHRLVEGCKVTPILLFNEADAIFGTRLEGSHHSVDKMENAIQNIILQEMETLEGILIATTNLTVNLDRAFERRFLYKIKFEQPSLEAKQHIWQDLLPELSESQAHELAKTYNFSGGQIENIARKKAVDDVLNDREGVDMAVMHDYCRTELLDKGSQITHAGFKTE